MLEWKQNRDGATALFINGARRVGKSAMAENFPRNECESYIVVDFADAIYAVWEAVDNTSDRNNFFMQLEFIYGVTLVPETDEERFLQHQAIEVMEDSKRRAKAMNGLGKNL